MTLVDFLFGGFTNKKKCGSSGMVVCAGVGFTLGVVAGMLFAPCSGEDCRERVGDAAMGVITKVKKTLHDVSATDTVQKV